MSDDCCDEDHGPGGHNDHEHGGAGSGVGRTSTARSALNFAGMIGGSTSAIIAGVHASRVSPGAPIGRHGRSFSSQLRYLLGIVIPSVWSREMGMLSAHTALLLCRTYISMANSRLDGKLVRHIVAGDKAKFLESLVMLLLIGIPATLVNSLIKYTKDSLVIAFRARLVTKAHGMYMNKDRVYYKAQHLDTTLQHQADQAMTDDIETFSDHLVHLYSHLSKPIVDLAFISATLYATARQAMRGTGGARGGGGGSRGGRGGMMGAMTSRRMLPLGAAAAALTGTGLLLRWCVPCLYVWWKRGVRSQVVIALVIARHTRQHYCTPHTATLLHPRVWSFSNLFSSFISPPFISFFFVLFFFVSVLFFFVPPFASGAPRTLVKWQRKKRS